MAVASKIELRICADGGAAKQLTFFNTDQIFAFDLSPDGKTMVLARGNVSDDVVLIVDAAVRSE